MCRLMFKGVLSTGRYSHAHHISSPAAPLLLLLLQPELLHHCPRGCHLSAQVVNQSRQIGRRGAAQVCRAAAAARSVACTGRGQHFAPRSRRDLFLELPASRGAAGVGVGQSG